MARARTTPNLSSAIQERYSMADNDMGSSFDRLAGHGLASPLHDQGHHTQRATETER
jgi:hypothetical protein